MHARSLPERLTQRVGASFTPQRSLEIPRARYCVTNWSAYETDALHRLNAASAGALPWAARGRRLLPRGRSAVVPRSTVDWDTSQADDFRDGGVSWVSDGACRSGRAPRSDRKSLA